MLGVVVIMCCVQDKDSLYMGLEYCPNGELYSQLQERGPLPVTDAAQYAAEIVDILAYLRQAHDSWLGVRLAWGSLEHGATMRGAT